MTTIIDGDQLRAIALGVRVTKSVSPASGSTDLFTITGGRVLVTALVGEVTTVMSATATSLSLQSDPTAGAAADIAAATVVTSDAVGTLYSITGVAADLLSAQTVTGTQVPGVAFAPASGRVVLPAGKVTQVGTAANTGVTEWTLCYIPLDDGAAVEAA